MLDKKKILVLGDDPYTTSGVGNTIRYFIQSMLKTNKYKFICVGGAVKHADYSIKKDEIWGDDWVTIPVDGFGSQTLVRDLIHVHKIDVVWFMTDPRFWGWLWQIDHEIRANVPMLYYHVWDNYPIPYFNKPYYISNDMIVTMSQISSDIIRNVTPEMPEKYIPLAVDTEIFKKISQEKYSKIKPKDKMVFFWNNRNARRKMSGTILWWFYDFLEKVGKDKACLFMHTQSNDPHGQNLEEIARQRGYTRENFILSQNRITPEDLAVFYNMADCTINISDAEGVGLGTIESLSCETPIIVNMTGGLQEQVTDAKNWFGIGINPASQAIVGSQEVPYIYEDRVSKEDFINSLLKMYNTSKEDREEMGRMGRIHVKNKYSLDLFAKEWEKTLDEFIEKNGSWETRKNYKTWSIKEF